MNKLEEYRALAPGKRYKLGEVNNDLAAGGFLAGFDAAIALDLPVKFAEYVDIPKSEDVEAWLLYFGYHPSLQEKYQYWIDNIYKPE